MFGNIYRTFAIKFPERSNVSYMVRRVVEYLYQNLLHAVRVQQYMDARVYQWRSYNEKVSFRCSSKTLIVYILLPRRIKNSYERTNTTDETVSTKGQSSDCIIPR